MARLDVGPFTVELMSENVPIEGQTTGGVGASGRSRLYGLTGPEKLELTIRDTLWDTSERDVVACHRHASPPVFDTLIERLRLSVLDYDGPYLELRQARLRPNGRAGLFDAAIVELDSGAGQDVEKLLLTAGADLVGTRKELVGDVGKTRRRIGVRFARAGADLVPITAYVLTRVASVARAVAAD